MKVVARKVKAGPDQEVARMNELEHLGYWCRHQGPRWSRRTLVQHRDVGRSEADSESALQMQGAPHFCLAANSDYSHIPDGISRTAIPKHSNVKVLKTVF